jgi:hypothetical protein
VHMRQTEVEGSPGLPFQNDNMILPPLGPVGGLRESTGLIMSALWDGTLFCEKEEKYHINVLHSILWKQQSTIAFLYSCL